MQHLMNLVRFPVTGFTLRPLVDGVGVVARELLHFIKSCLDMERTATYYQDSEQSGFIDFSFLSPYWMFDMDGDNDTNSESAVPEEHEQGDESLAEAERKYKEASESIAQLENEMSDLMSQVDTLRGSVQEMRSKLSEMQNEYAESIRNLKDEIEAHTNMKSQYNEMKEMHDDLLEDWETAKDFLKSVIFNTEEQKNIFNQETESLKTSLTELEKEYRALLNINEELAIENTDLNTEVWTLQDLLHELEVELFETRRRLDELTTEHEDGDISLAEAERKYKEAMDSMAQLENEKSDLMSQLDTLRDSVQALYEKCMKYDEIRDSPTEAERRYEKAMEINTQLERKDKYLTFKVNALQEDLSLTRIKWKDAVREHEEGDVSLAEAERKYKEASESIAQLENEKSDLMSQVDTLRGSVQELSEKCTKYDEIRVFLVDILTKYKDAMMCNDKLENEKSALKYHAHILQGSVQAMEEMLSDAEKKCDAIKQERDQEWEAHSILTSLYNLMTLTPNKKLLMDSQAEAQMNSEDKRDSTTTPEDEQQQGCFSEE